MPILLQLFLTFAKIGLFTFGGGYAMIFMIVNNVMNISAENGFEMKALILTAVLAAVAFLSKPVLKKKV